MATRLLLRRCCAVRLVSCRLPAIVAVLALCALTTPASASLIVDSMRYDGRVKSVATTGTEAHFTNVDLLPNSAGTLPADNSALPAPLVNGNNLTTTLTEANDTFNGMPVRHAIITISTLQALNVFNNTLDPGIALPVTFDAVMYSNSLGAGQFVDVKGITVENFGPPFLPPGSQTITGVGNPASPLGSPANPMRVQLGIAAGQVDDYRYGFVKLNIFYGTPQIPEPMSWLLMLVGFAGIGMCRKRR